MSRAEPQFPAVPPSPGELQSPAEPQDLRAAAAAAPSDRLPVGPRAGATCPPVRIKRLATNPDLPLPGRESEGAAGYDVRSCADVRLEPGEVCAVPTGIAIELPPGIECQVRPRSGLAVRRRVTVPNSPGTIDWDYRGEIKVLLQNLGDAPVDVRRGDRVAQLVFAWCLSPAVEEVVDVSETPRGAAGFGSTGDG